MNIAKIKYHDVANGPGVRISLFVSGCSHHCPGCFNPETWDPAFGMPFTSEQENYILEQMEPEYIAGLSVLGGEPFEPDNLVPLLLFLRQVRLRYPDKSIWAYSGYTLEELLSREGSDGVVTKQLLRIVDILVDGPFIEEQKNLSLRFRGSENQRLILTRETMDTGTLTLWDEEEPMK